MDLKEDRQLQFCEEGNAGCVAYVVYGAGLIFQAGDIFELGFVPPHVEEVLRGHAEFIFWPGVVDGEVGDEIAFRGEGVC